MYPKAALLIYYKYILNPTPWCMYALKEHVVAFRGYRQNATSFCHICMLFIIVQRIEKGSFTNTKTHRERTLLSPNCHKQRAIR